VANDAVVGRFRAYLGERELPVTSQRLAIAEVLLHAPGHLSAEDVASQAVERGHKVGLATVYRTIDLLVASGLVVERDFGEGFRRFEPSRDLSRHEQLLCSVCGAVEECPDERIERITRTIPTARGFARERHQLVIHGVCRACQRAVPAIDRRLS
jgi:Fur family ferric uptake transcriptional regulator